MKTKSFPGSYLFSLLIVFFFTSKTYAIPVTKRQQMVTDSARDLTSVDRWSPKASEGLTWQWQLQGQIKASKRVDMYDIDLFDAPQEVIDKLHRDGRIVVCYFSAGSYEGWREDWAQFFDFIEEDKAYEGDEPPFAGKMDGWDERWLDIREIALLTPIMQSRMALAASKGCDAVEPDNMDAYSNSGETGLELTYGDQIAFNKFIAAEAHAAGLSIGLKNDLDQLEDLVDYFDWALNEQCFEYDECDLYSVFTDVDKAVFGVEYHGCLCNFCAKARCSNLSWMKKKLSLRSWRRGCDDLLTRILCWFQFL
jgi:hypothetical protein